MQTIVESINNYYQIKKNRGFHYYHHRNNLSYCKKDIFLICCNEKFFDTNFPVPIKFLNPDILLKKGNNIIFVEVLLDNYSKKFTYSIDI